MMMKSLLVVLATTALTNAHKRYRNETMVTTISGTGLPTTSTFISPFPTNNGSFVLTPPGGTPTTSFIVTTGPGGSATTIPTSFIVSTEPGGSVTTIPATPTSFIVTTGPGGGLTTIPATNTPPTPTGPATFTGAASSNQVYGLMAGAGLVAAYLI